mmetsp:Transcript_70067/g.194748  ORF Transcript_70067/g.194748 Transcript_70067/m.194748 type:complete len:412 (+) Transcript_70067:339-1574(+)
MPYFCCERCISCTRVVISLAPVPPSGCPSAIAPPFTFRRSIFIPTALTHASGTGANASFTSYKPIWSMLKPVRSNTFFEAGTGPSSMITGSEPTTSRPTNFARGRTFNFSKPRSLTMSTAAAPSQICEETPAVITPSLWSALSLAKLSGVVGRMPSSTSCMPSESPLLRLTGTGTISLLKRPSLVAARARLCERAPNSSSSLLVMLYFLANNSAPPNWLNMAGLMPNSVNCCNPSEYFSCMASVNGKPVPACMPATTFEPMGTRDITSTPPAITTSCTPLITAWAAKWRDCWDEPHCRSTAHPGTDSGRRFEARTTLRPMFPACDPIWDTQPKITSSTCAPSMPVRSTRASHTVAPRSAGCQPESAPLRLPPAVRHASTTYAVKGLKEDDAAISNGWLRACLARTQTQRTA